MEVERMTDHKSVWIISQGSYSDWHTVAIFDDEIYADEFIKRYGSNPTHSWDKMSKDEYILNPTRPTPKQLYKCWAIRMYRDGTVDTAKEEKEYFPETLYDEGFNVDYGNKSNLYFQCYAQDVHHAIKIANERRTFLIAQDIWVEYDKDKMVQKNQYIRTLNGRYYKWKDGEPYHDDWGEMKDES